VDHLGKWVASTKPHADPLYRPVPFAHRSLTVCAGPHHWPYHVAVRVAHHHPVPGPYCSSNGSPLGGKLRPFDALPELRICHYGSLSYLGDRAMLSLGANNGADHGSHNLAHSASVRVTHGQPLPGPYCYSKSSPHGGKLRPFHALLKTGEVKRTMSGGTVSAIPTTSLFS
jgi:hypothetical protein